MARCGEDGCSEERCNNVGRLPLWISATATLVVAASARRCGVGGVGRADCAWVMCPAEMVKDSSALVRELQRIPSEGGTRSAGFYVVLGSAADLISYLRRVTQSLHVSRNCDSRTARSL